MEIMELLDVSVFNVLRVEETRHRVRYTSQLITSKFRQRLLSLNPPLGLTVQFQY